MMNWKDDHNDEVLERIIDLAESGRELTDEELASMMQDEEAMRAYREMMLMKSAVSKAADKESPDTEDIPEKKTLFAFFTPKILKYAAACLLIVAGIGVLYIKNQRDRGYVAFERVNKIPEIVVSADGKDHKIEKRKPRKKRSSRRILLLLPSSAGSPTESWCSIMPVPKDMP